ncbi:hypothetical protein F4779DRAFT_74933 [Xylariaceae sp. FL0662B]|nr:hypothetical protein F4779DRAFT_74933 [Xylariaceae sp. FL0662B]
MERPQSVKRSTSITSLSFRVSQHRPPLYSPKEPMSDRTPEKDKQALQMAVGAYKSLVEKRQKCQKYKDALQKDHLEAEVTASEYPSQRVATKQAEKHGTDTSQSLREKADQLTTILQTFQPTEEVNQQHAWAPKPDMILPLNSMYDGTGKWPKKNDPVKGARQYSWSNIGFPENDDLVLEDYEEYTHIDKENSAIIELAQDIVNIQKKPAREIADEGAVKFEEEHGRVIETFRVHDRTVSKIKFKDCDVFNGGAPYSKCKMSRAVKEEIDKAMGSSPDVAIEQRVAAHILLSRAGQIGGRTQDYWKKARDLAQQALYKEPDLGKNIRIQIKDETEDANFDTMMRIVEESIQRKTANPYHQARRDQYAADHGLFYRVEDSEIIMILDKADNVIAFQMDDAFRKFLRKGIENKVVKSIETYSTLQPVPLPDMTRHGLHWVDWLIEHPEFDSRVPQNDPRIAKSGVYHFGANCTIGDPHGKKPPNATKDTTKHTNSDTHVLIQLRKLRYSALGACSELVGFFLELLDPSLFAQYQAVAEEVSKLKVIPFETRHSGDTFSLWAILVNMMTNDHKDRSDWFHGFAGLVPVGEFTGGDLLLRELGLQIESKPGCVQLIRGRELAHSITKWTGRRFVVVSATHEAVRRWAFRQRGWPVTDATPSGLDSCLDVNQEDVVPEDQRDLELRYAQGDPEWEEEEESSPRSHLESSASDKDLPKVGSSANRKASKVDSTSDASGEESAGAANSSKRRKKHSST